MVATREDVAYEKQRALRQATNGMVSVLQDRAVLLEVRFSKLGNSKTLDQDLVQSEVAESMRSSTKKLLASPELTAIGRIDSQIGRYLRTQVGLPSPFSHSFHLIPINLIDQVEAYLEEMKRQRVEVKDAFKERYVRYVDDARVKLGPAFNQKDYPSVESLDDRFDMFWWYISLGTPDGLPRALFEKERAKFANQWQDTFDEIRSTMREAMAELVENAAKLFEPAPDGGKKVFREAPITNLKAFLDTFDARNIAGDKDLEDLATRARGLLSGVTSAQLKDGVDLRARVQAGMAEIKERMAGMVETKSTRRHMGLDEAIPEQPMPKTLFAKCPELGCELELRAEAMFPVAGNDNLVGWKISHSISSMVVPFNDIGWSAKPGQVRELGVLARIFAMYTHLVPVTGVRVFQTLREFLPLRCGVCGDRLFVQSFEMTQTPYFTLRHASAGGSILSDKLVSLDQLVGNREKILGNLALWTMQYHNVEPKPPKSTVQYGMAQQPQPKIIAPKPARPLSGRSIRFDEEIP